MSNFIRSYCKLIGWMFVSKSELFPQFEKSLIFFQGRHGYIEKLGCVAIMLEFRRKLLN